jgi:GIY-YIG catalytic domain-containing protein
MTTPVSADPIKRRLMSGALHSWADFEASKVAPPRAPGIYAWFFRSIPGKLPIEGCVQREGATLLYVGISPGSTHSKETLRSRIRYHFHGNAEGSTLRRTLGCLLEEDLDTVLRCVGSGKRMTFGPHENALTRWMEQHAAVTWVEVERPWLLESQLIRELVLPLNIDSNDAHPYYSALRQLRKQACLRARQLLVIHNIRQHRRRIEAIVPTKRGAAMSTPIEKALIESWREFKRYAEAQMGYTNPQNLNECLNGAGAFVDFLLGRSSGRQDNGCHDR